MLWKYFHNCIYSFRENWEINCAIWHTLLTLTRSSLHFQRNWKYIFSVVWILRGQLFMGMWHNFYLLDRERWIRLIPPPVRKTSPWLANFSSISATICLLLKIFFQDNNFLYLKSISSFPTFVCSELIQKFCYCT